MFASLAAKIGRELISTDRPGELGPGAGGYLEFLRQTVPAGWSLDAPHLRLIAEHLDAVLRGEIDRLAVHMPPRHGKSETVTYRLPVCWLEGRPRDNVLITGYNERFARKFGRRTRNLAQGRGLVSPAKAAADEWETPQGGLLMTRGVGSPPTGTGFQGILIDDPVRRREDADSEVWREKAWDWYTDDLYSRLEPGGWIVLIMTLWHEDDLGARAVASEPGRWTVLKLPALAEDGDILGRSPGAALWPERYDEAALDRIREVMRTNEGERSWQALYQQNPTPREGSFFRTGQFGYVEAGEVPAGLRSARGWDLGATAGAGDWTAGVRLAGPDPQGIWYVLDVKRGRWATDERNALLRGTAEADGPGVVQRLPQDPGQAGVDQARALLRLLAGYAVRVERVTGPKETRADPWSAQVNAGNVRLVRAAWNGAFVEEHRAFPLGQFDDQVDAASDAFAALSRGGGLSFWSL